MKNSGQIPLDFEHQPQYGAGDFVCGKANEQAHKWISEWPEWPENMRMLNIFGPAASGKTHLSFLLPQLLVIRVPEQLDAWMVDEFYEKIEDKETGPYIFVCECDEAGMQSDMHAFFNLFNQIKQSHHFLIFFSREPIAHYDIELPDLRSRLRSVLAQQIYLPDDALLEAVLAKLAADKQIILSQDIIKLIVSRSERSFDAIKEILAALDKLGLAEQKPISKHLVRQLFSS